MKKDFKLLKYTDFRNTLNQRYKFIFDCVLIAKNYDDFNHLKEFSEVFTNNHLSQGEKIEKYKKWYADLDEEYKQFFYDNPHSMNFYNYLVSVIVPTYNSESSIGHSFNSLLNQTIGFEKLEIIFVDDASTDNTPNIIDDYASQYDNVTAIHLEENSGYAGKPRNIGIDNSTCEYLMFLDSDDVFMEDACEILYDEISLDALDLVGGVHCDGSEVPEYLWLNILTDPKYSLGDRRREKEKLFENDDFSLKVTSIDEYPSIISNANVWDKIFKKSFIENNNITFPEYVPAEDSVFLFNSFLNANGIKFIDKIILKHFYQREGSIQNHFSKLKLKKRLDAYYQMYDLAIDKNKVDIFAHYLLITKLQHFLFDQIKLSNLPADDILELLQYAKPLYDTFLNFGGFLPENLDVFKDISEGRYEKVFEFIYGDVPKPDEDTQNIYSFQDTQISTEIDLSYMRPLKREKVQGKFNAFLRRDELSAVSYENALVLPGNNRNGGVIDCNGQLVEESTSAWFGGAYDVDDQTIEHDERTVVFLGEYATSTWGHAHVSLLVRFWFCLSQNVDVDAYVIICEHPGQKNDNKPLNDFIRMAGFEEKVIFIDRPTQFKRVIVPEPSFTRDWYSNQFCKTMNVIKRNALKEPIDFMETPEKIFLSRSHFERAKSAEGGLELLDDYFKENGFTIIYPEEISLAQMVRIMQNAKVCASESGSITFNTLFANANLEVIVIERIPLFSDGNLLTNLSPAKRIAYVDGCYVLYPGGVGGACMLGFTDEFERFTNDNGYCSPSPPYLEADYKNKCLEIYQKRYDMMNTYKQWLNWNKPDWLPVVYEAFLASIDQFPQLDRKTIIETYYKDIV